MRDLEREGPDCARLNTLRAAAERARDAVVAGDLDAFGQAMCDNTTAQAQLQRDLIPPDAWRAIAIAEAHNAAGWKVNGAGGDGGSLTLLASNQPGAKRAMVHAIMRDNPRLQRIPIVLSAGLRVWDQTDRKVYEIRQWQRVSDTQSVHVPIPGFRHYVWGSGIALSPNTRPSRTTKAWRSARKPSVASLPACGGVTNSSSASE